MKWMPTASLNRYDFSMIAVSWLPVALVLSALALATGVACRAPWPATAEPPRALTYIAIGASDSVGVGADVPEAEGWVPVLHSRMPSGSQLINLGVSGSLLRQALDQQLPVALDSSPDLVTVWLAVNDLNARVPLERYSDDLDAMLRALRENTHATVFVGNIPDVTRLPVYQQVDRALIEREVGRWNAAIEGIVSRYGAHLVDLNSGSYELAQHPEYVARDGFHPSSEGYRRLAEIFLDAVQQRTSLL